MSAERDYRAGEFGLEYPPGEGAQANSASGAAPSTAGYYPFDILFLTYSVLASALLLMSPLTCPSRLPLTVAHLLLMLGFAALRFVPRGGHWLLFGIRHLYPLALIPFLYKSIQFLNRLVTTRYFDSQVIALERTIFGFQPSQSLWQQLPYRVLSEFLHFSYLAYVPTVMGLPIFLFVTRRREEFRVFATSVLSAFICCYLISILIPVKGPFHHFGSLVSQGLPSFFAPVVVWMLEGGSSVGTAFPSSHVAASVCAWMVSRRVIGRLSWLVLVIVVGIFAGTIYGGFHYATDAVVGLVVGLVMGLMGPRIYAGLLYAARRLAGHPSRPARSAH